MLNHKRRVARAPLHLAITAAASLLPATAHATVTYSISGTWPGSTASTAASGMALITTAFNNYGDFGNFNFDVTYQSGVPTAQSNYLGQIQVGGSATDVLLRRVLQHETNHVMGSGTTSAWSNTFNASSIWTGGHMNSLVAQFDGDGSVIHQSGVHFYGYGLNYNTEVTDIDAAIGADTVYMRNVALLYAQRQDDGLGNAANPWSATAVSLTKSDAAGTSAFNNWGVWSDNYFAHPNAAYSTGNFVLRTPLDTYTPTGATPSFTFAGDSLTINNTNGSAGGLQYNGVGSTGTIRVKNLILNGGYVSQNASPSALFTIAGNVTVLQSPTIDAAQGSISITAPISGSGNLTKAGPFALTLSGANSYAGNTTINAGTLRLAAPTPIASYSFANLSGTTVLNTGTGGTALNGTFNANGGSGSITTTGGPQASLGALVLNGTGSTVDINSGITDLSGNGTWTVSAWIKTTQAGATLLNKGDGADWSNGYSTFYLGTGNNSGAGGVPDAVRYAGGFLAGSASVNNGAWHQITYTDSAGAKAIYVDGVLSSLAQNAFTTYDSGSTVRIGFSPAGQGDGQVPTNGSLSGVQFYTSALSASQVQQLYANTLTTNVLPSATNVTIYPAAVLDVNGTLQTVASLTGTVGSAIKLGNGQLTVSSSANSAFAGIITGHGGSLTKSGTGTLTLSGKNTYTGPTLINNGTLRLALPITTSSSPIISYSFAHLSGTTVINDGSGGSYLNGALNLNGGSGFINPTGGPIPSMGALVLNGSGTTVDLNAPTTLTDFSGTASWALSLWIKTTQPGATLLNKGDGANWSSGFSTFYLGTANNSGSGGIPDAVRYAGGWAAGSTVVNDGSWHMITYSDYVGAKSIYVDGVLDTLSQNQFTTPDTGSKIRIGFAPSSETDGEVATSGSIAGFSIYNGPLSAAQVAALYTSVVGGSPLPSTTDLTLANAGTLDLNGLSQSINSLAGSGNVTLGSATLTVGNSASTQFSGSISGTGLLSLRGTGTLTLTGSNAYTGGTTINTGATLSIAALGALSPATPITNNGNLLINAESTAGVISGTGSLIIGTPATPATLHLSSGVGASKTASLTVNAGAQLDLANNSLIVEPLDAPTKSAALTQLTGLVTQGRNGGTWNGPGITSATVAANPTQYAIAVVDNAVLNLSTFNSQSVDANSIIITPALFGDANIDGHVDLNDLNTVLNNLGVSATDWTSGNFDGAATIDLNDLNQVLNNLGVSGISGSTVEALGAQAAPEPTSLGVLLAAGAIFGRRRNRKI